MMPTSTPLRSAVFTLVVVQDQRSFCSPAEPCPRFVLLQGRRRSSTFQETQDLGFLCLGNAGVALQAQKEQLQLLNETARKDVANKKSEAGTVEDIGKSTPDSSASET
ncbi:hypothetical protein MHU86_14042 [Fragilaria crotonensis]|nr:hypothetical protein MHU86_14042 [Fragilaria crotonensis]